MKSFTQTVGYDQETDSYYIELGTAVTDELGWNIGDELNWEDNGDGSFTLTKKESPEMEWVMVDTVQTFHHRYCVQVPKGKAEWALDTVTMQEAEEFSQQHLGETIVTHRVVTQEEALAICDEENDYTEGWTQEQKLRVFFTKHKE